ncbi:MAG: cbb3-type cytochrome c oxidase subunit I [Thermomicrobiales bacterium]
MSSVAVTQSATIDRETSGVFVAEQMWPIRWQLYLMFIALAVGGWMGLGQALERVGVTMESFAGLESYYQGLSIHGVTLALVLTFSFANSLLSLLTIEGFKRPLASTMLLQGSFWFMAAGLGLAAVILLMNQATVLFTFYTPMEANPLFYLAAVFLVVSTWLTLANLVWTYRQWRADNPDERIPLPAYLTLTTYIMWGLASIGIAVEVVVFVLPWSLGIWDSTDPQLNRIFFWFTGHAIVYFWLLPAYVSWYMLIPRQVGARLFSDGLTRLTFLLFLLFSVPTGLHHQYTDPGISGAMKSIHLVLTFVIFFPSLITAFSIMAVLESAGRKAGGKGLFGWIPALPWGNPSVNAQLLAMLVFTLGGATGLINASMTVNLVVHNTAFIPGHFHLTVGTAVALTIMGVCYWMVPYLSGKKLFQPKLALAQGWLWAIGVLTFSRGQISGGLESMPRRTAIGQAAYELPGWELSNWLTAIGGVTMAVSGALFFLVIVGTLFLSKEPTEHTEIPITGEPLHGPRESWTKLDRLGMWTVVAAVLIIFAYLPTLIAYLPAAFNSPGVKVW